MENNYKDKNRYINICRARNSILAFYRQHLNPKYKNIILLTLTFYLPVKL